MGSLELRTRPVCTDGVPFDCTVYVTGARPGADVMIRLRQTEGVEPWFSEQVEVPIALDGTGAWVFSVVLRGAGSAAHLIADHLTPADPLFPDAADVDVVAP